MTRRSLAPRRAAQWPLRKLPSRLRGRRGCVPGAILPPEHILLPGGTRRHADTDPKTAAALEFAVALVEGRGNIGDMAFARIGQAGFSEGEIAEIIANVALNIFTNYFNKAADVVVDFPRVSSAA